MSPNGQARGKKVTVPYNLYTIILALAFCAVLATAAFAAYQCYAQYGTLFKIPT
ncbi:MAG: hypothetical protein IIB56_07905 [Planctomycetes bacterium]|nr:hypothetical protein [Planctomycetota bacterium]MCH8119086.1 hypothetical protein [Planctomycetota bacterium]